MFGIDVVILMGAGGATLLVICALCACSCMALRKAARDAAEERRILAELANVDIAMALDRNVRRSLDAGSMRHPTHDYLTGQITMDIPRTPDDSPTAALKASYNALWDTGSPELALAAAAASAASPEYSEPVSPTATTFHTPPSGSPTTRRSAELRTNRLTTAQLTNSSGSASRADDDGTTHQLPPEALWSKLMSQAPAPLTPFSALPTGSSGVPATSPTQPSAPEMLDSTVQNEEAILPSFALGMTPRRLEDQRTQSADSSDDEDIFGAL